MIVNGIRDWVSLSIDAIKSFSFPFFILLLLWCRYLRELRQADAVTFTTLNDSTDALTHTHTHTTYMCRIRTYVVGVCDAVNGTSTEIFIFASGQNIFYEFSNGLFQSVPSNQTVKKKSFRKS